MALRASNDSLPLSDLIQSTATARRTARISAESEAGDGQIYILKGQIIHAVYGDLVGDEAVYAMVAAAELEYQVEAGVTTQTRTITSSWQALLLDAARHEDEGSLPQPTAAPARLEPLSASSTSMTGMTGMTGMTNASVVTIPSEAQPQRRSALVPVLLGGLALAACVLGWVALQPKPEPELAAASPAAASEPEVGSNDLHVYEANELTAAGDRPPRLVHGAPALAPRRTSLAPSVVVRVQLDRAGEVVDRKVLRPRADLADFEAAALERVAHYDFAAAQHAGHEVAAWLNVPVSFEQPMPLGRRAIRIKGSDTIGGDLGPALAAAYADYDPHVLATVEALGSSSGFVGLFEGSAEIGASSRPLDASELAQAEQRGIGLRETVIGYDGIAVIVHPDNPIRALDLVQLAKVFSGKVDNWNQLGGADQPITLLGRPSTSGTHGLFATKVLEASALGPLDFAPQITDLETSQAVVEKVAEDPGAIGYVGVAWATPAVEVLAIASGPGQAALTPSPAEIAAGSYPIYRPLIFYTRQALDRDTIGLLRFVLGERGQAIVAEHGFVPVGVQTEDALPQPSEASERAPVYVTRLVYDSAVVELDEDQRATLVALVAALSPGSRITLVGNAETEGLVEGNERLAVLRTESVKAFLIGEGVAAARIDLRSAATAGVIEDLRRRAERRRVDVYVVDAK